MKKILILFTMVIMASTAFAQFRVEAGYLSTKQDYNNIDKDNLNGYKIGAYYGFSVPLIPIVLETGISYAMGFNKEETKVSESKDKYAFISVPVNLGFEIGLGDMAAVRPYAGLCAKYNTMGKNEYTSKVLNTVETVLENDWLKENGHKYQLGGQIGVLVKVVGFTVGYQYQSDWTKAIDEYERVTFPSHSVTVGYCF